MKHDTVLFIFVMLDTMSMTMSVPYFIDFVISELGGDAVSAGAAASTRALCTAIAVPILGSLSDKYADRSLGQMALLVALGAILTHLLELNSTNYLIYMISRIVFGVTRGGAAIANSSACDSRTSAEERSQAMGRTGAAAGIAFVFGAGGGGFLAAYGYQVPTLVTLGAATLNFIFVFFFFKESKVVQATKKEEEQKPGLFAVVAALFGQSSTRALFAFHILMVFAILSVQHAYFEYMRINLAMSPSSRGIYLLVLGLSSAAVQSNLQTLQKLLGGQYNTLLVGLVLSVGVNFTSPLSPALPFYALAWVGTLFGFLPSLTLGLLSEKSTKAVQGSLMGLHESLVNFGGVIGPIFCATTSQVSHVIPFWTSSSALLLCVLWSFALPALRKSEKGAKKSE